MIKPFLFLDVDGVVNACPPIDGEEVLTKKGFPICIPSGTKERLARLLDEFEPVWATAWRGDAHSHFQVELGLGETPWPHIEFEVSKLLSIFDRSIRSQAFGWPRPWVWIDDDATSEMEILGVSLNEERCLALCPDMGAGLTDEHVERALAFAATFREES